MKSLPYKLATTNDILTSRAGLACVGELMDRISFTQHIDQSFPLPGSNRGYTPSTYVKTFMMLLHEGGCCLEDVRHLKNESALMSVFGLEQIPSADALGDWLRRLGKSKTGINALSHVNKILLGAALHDCKQVTLDIDATAIFSKKAETRYTYLKERGYMPMVGHIEQTGQIVSMAFRRGNVPPAKDNLGFIKQCVSALPTGVCVTKLRIDAAGYQAAILDYAFEHDIEFAVRAKMSQGLRELIMSRAESDWCPLVERDGKTSETESSCRLVHSMNDSQRPFTVVVQRKPKRGQHSIEFEGENQSESIYHDGYLYRAVATNRDELNDSDIIAWYNQRAEHSENRIKELKSDFAGGALPCGEFKANELYFGLCGLAYNLFALMRHLLPAQWAQCRVTTIRWRLYALAGKVVRHGRQITIKLREEARSLLDEALQPLRRFAPP